MIEWTDQTWNPTTGCTKISPGCQNCYAEIMARRLKAIGVNGYENGFNLTLQSKRLCEPLFRKKPTLYFVNSMSDLFHEQVPEKYICKVLNVMMKAKHHIFQVLTKRAKRMADFFQTFEIPENVWVGVSVENKKHGIPRIDELSKINASVRFLSMEPLLEDLGPIKMRNIHWAIVGGESGPKSRRMSPHWVENIKNQCEAQNVLFFFKQWGGWGADGKKRSKKANGRIFLGTTWDEMPIQSHLQFGKG